MTLTFWGQVTSSLMRPLDVIGHVIIGLLICKFPIDGPLKPLLYLASLLRYYVSHLAKHISIENTLIPF